jgi:hypothetical protein
MNHEFWDQMWGRLCSINWSKLDCWLRVIGDSHPIKRLQNRKQLKQTPVVYLYCIYYVCQGIYDVCSQGLYYVIIKKIYYIQLIYIIIWYDMLWYAMIWYIYIYHMCMYILHVDSKVCCLIFVESMKKPPVPWCPPQPPHQGPPALWLNPLPGWGPRSSSRSVEI